MPLRESELILNSDGSIYHLNLHPGDVAPTVITVGDPDRVAAVSKHFASLELQKGKREFVAHTGYLNQKRLTVISTGIGTDNIDIVLNELDALVNVDFASRTIKKDLTHLDIVRIGTSGALQADIPVDSFLISERAIGFDGLFQFYTAEDSPFATHFSSYLQDHGVSIAHYVTEASKSLCQQLDSNRIRFGVTVTNAGFYGPQGRKIRLSPKYPDLNALLQTYRFEGRPLTNLEMETAGIYGLATALGHHAVSMNAILANRATGAFSTRPADTVEALIQYTLEKLT